MIDEACIGIPMILTRTHHGDFMLATDESSADEDNIQRTATFLARHLGRAILVVPD